MTTPTLRPLEGLKIVDLSRVLSGPFCTMVLADLGADVIKIEEPGSGDTTRGFSPHVGGESHYFLAINRNKRSVAVDLKTEEGLRIVKDLIERADVVVENFRPGVAARLGLDADTLRARNPQLIYCSISGFGQDSSERDRPAYDIVIQALTGAMEITGEAGRLPAKMGLPVADQVSGIYAAIQILAALRRRDAEGSGASIDVSMWEVSTALLSYMANAYLATGQQPQRLGSSHPTIYPYNAFATSDGYITVAPFTNRFWRNFCAVVERPDLAENEEYKRFGGRLKHRAELSEMLDEIMRQRTTDEWMRLLEIGDVPCGPVKTVGQALSMPQTIERGMVVEREHPTAGTIRTLGSPFHFDFAGRAVYTAPDRPAPLLGEHTRSVLTEELGYDPDGQPTPAAAEAATAPTAPRKGGDPASLPLRGVRVLDLTRMLAGPYAGLLLADMGAEVIKVEELGLGDPTRVNLPLIDGHSTYFMSVNRGKHSIAVDLKSDEGRSILLDLVRESDVVVENFRPGVMARLGLDYESLRAANERIILCSISGFGQTGPLSEKISFDLVNQAMSGCMAITGERGREPVRIGLPIGDLSGGYFGVISILAALRARDEAGYGSHIDLGIHDLLVYQLGYVAQLHFTSGEDPEPVGSGHHHIAPYRAYAGNDGLFVVAAFTQAYWLKFLQALQRPDISDDPRFTLPEDRKVHMAELDSALEAIFAEQPVAHWVERFDRAGVPVAPIQSIGDTLDSALCAERELVFEVEHAQVGTVRTIGTALRADDVIWRSPLPAEELGLSTDSILSSVLGYDRARIEGMHERGVVSSPQQPVDA